MSSPTPFYNPKSPQVGALVYRKYTTTVCGKVISVGSDNTFVSVRWLDEGKPEVTHLASDLKCFQLLGLDHQRKWMEISEKAATAEATL